MKAVRGLSGDEIVDEIGGRGEADTLTAQAGELTDGISEVSLADPRGADEDAVGLVADEVERGGAHDLLAVDALRAVEVEGLDRGQREDGGALESRLGAAFELDAKLLAHEVIKERGGRVVTGDGFAGGGIEQRGGVLKAENAQHLLQLQGGGRLSGHARRDLGRRIVLS